MCQSRLIPATAGHRRFGSAAVKPVIPSISFRPVTIFAVTARPREFARVLRQLDPLTVRPV